MFSIRSSLNIYSQLPRKAFNPILTTQFAMSTSTKPLTTVKSLDHIVLTCASIPATISFYTKYLGMTHSTFTPPSTPDVTRHSLNFGLQKINLHQKGKEFEPKAQTALPGTADLCFLVEEGTSLEDAIEGFGGDEIEVLEGGNVVLRTGARGRLRSIYVRDPDGNLIE
jgi:catechol 2,3-dioxygenase-like lactoylglutathione lyase family enzyme